jgi:hypothetical protein
MDFESFSKEVKLGRKFICISVHLRFKKICQIENLQPNKSPGCQNRPSRDEKMKYCATAEKLTPEVPRVEVQMPSLICVQHYGSTVSAR